MRPNTTRVCRVLRRVGFRCVHAATSLVLASPSTSSARRARRCTGPRLSDGLAGLARRLGWPCHFMTVRRAIFPRALLVATFDALVRTLALHLVFTDQAAVQIEAGMASPAAERVMLVLNLARSQPIIATVS